MVNLRHVVLLSFFDVCTKEQVKITVDAFVQLKDKIKGIKELEWGVNNSPELDNKFYTHAFFLTFHSEGDRNEYITDPSHLGFKDAYGKYLSQLLVIDYWAS